MLLLSIDIETTGLNPDTCQIIQIGACVIDTDHPDVELATFETLVKHDVITGEPYALAMNAELLKRIAKGEGLDLDTAMQHFAWWVAGQARRLPWAGKPHKFTPVGKNYGGFDKLFLRKHPLFAELPLTHRAFDLGNIYWQPHIDGASLPDSQECMKRAGQHGEVAHTALEDAIVVARAVARHVGVPLFAPVSREEYRSMAAKLQAEDRSPHQVAPAEDRVHRIGQPKLDGAQPRFFPFTKEEFAAATNGTFAGPDQYAAPLPPAGTGKAVYEMGEPTFPAGMLVDEVAATPEKISLDDYLTNQRIERYRKQEEARPKLGKFSHYEDDQPVFHPAELPAEITATPAIPDCDCEGCEVFGAGTCLDPNFDPNDI